MQAFRAELSVAPQGCLANRTAYGSEAGWQ